MRKKILTHAIAAAIVLASSAAHATTLTGNPAVIAPDATCLNDLSFYPGQWHAHATAHSWIFTLGRMHVVCGRHQS